MPTYQYACTECEHGFEVVQRFTDSSLTECPECSGRLRKLFNAVGVVFKGSGFYTTDSRSDGKESAAAASSGSASSNGASGSGESGGSGGSGGSRASSDNGGAPAKKDSARPKAAATSAA